jgi:ubiquinone/menaquinone biosynthesis C-methylase UbiE
MTLSGDLDPLQKEYSRLAPTYDRRWSFYIKASIQATVNRLMINPQDRILDLGCGTGTLIQHLFQLVPNAAIVGLDISSEMLTVARQKLPESVELHLGDVGQLPFPNESFNTIISTSAFHYIRNPVQAIQEMKRVLKPDGCLIITDWCNDFLTCRILDVALHCINRAHFHTYTVHELQTLLKHEGFSEVGIERYKINWFWGLMTATAIKR